MLNISVEREGRDIFKKAQLSPKSSSRGATPLYVNNI